MRVRDAMGLLTLIAVVACNSGAPKPDAIRPDEDSCASCRMQISERRFATEVLTAEGQYLKFDDLGCFRSYLQNKPELRAESMWVTSYETGLWMDARSAAYLLDSGERTPMGSGIVAIALPSTKPVPAGARRVSFEEMMNAGR